MGYRIITGDALSVLSGMSSGSVQCCITSPPYWGLRKYLPAGHGAECSEIGTESTPDEFIANLVAVFAEVRRVLTDDGLLWVNIGDSYSGSGGQGTKPRIMSEEAARARGGRPIRVADLKPKDLVGIPWMLAFALRADGWYLRQDIIWSKGSCMPESVRDRCTKSHEYLFLLSKSPRYYFDQEAIKEPSVTFNDSLRNRDESKMNNTPGRSRMGGLVYNQYQTRNKRSVWHVNPEPFSGNHFACFPKKLIEPCVLSGSRVGDTILDPFSGSGTTGVVALNNGRKYIGIELNPEYRHLSLRRIEPEAAQPPLLVQGSI